MTHQSENALTVRVWTDLLESRLSVKMITFSVIFSSWLQFQPVSQLSITLQISELGYQKRVICQLTVRPVLSYELNPI